MHRHFGTFPIVLESPLTDVINTKALLNTVGCNSERYFE